MAPAPTLGTGDMITMIQRAAKDPDVDVAKMERLLAMAERMDDRKAQRLYNEAFAKLQQHMPKIQKTKSVESKGKLLYKYADFEHIMDQVQPLLSQYGFSVSFESGVIGSGADARVTQACIIRHAEGHIEKNQPFAARIGSGPPNSSASQGDGAASTYAKRFALCNALNIVIEQDTDGRAVGEAISLEEAGNYRARVKACGINEIFFLQFAQVVLSENATMGEIAEGYSRIGTSICPQLNKMLESKEKKKAPAA